MIMKIDGLRLGINNISLNLGLLTVNHITSKGGFLQRDWYNGL